MPSFSTKSSKILSTCHPDIQFVLNEAIKIVDFSVIDGYRGQYRQNKYYWNGSSKLQFPNSKHNRKPSLAVDIIPWPTQYSNKYEFYRLAGVILAVAACNNINIEWGGDWNSFQDMPHFEIA